MIYKLQSYLILLQDEFVLVFCTLLDGRFELFFYLGMGIPVGYVIPAGNGDGEKISPVSLMGTGTGKFSPHGDGDGEAEPDGEFPVAIFGHGRRTQESPRPQGP